MKFISFALLALVLVSGFATEQDDQHDLETLRRMEKTEFGQTILDTIQLQLSAEGPVEDLVKMLQNIEADLQKEQDEDNKFIDKLQGECDAGLEKLQDEIKQAKERIAELTAELDLKIPIRDEKVRQRADKFEFQQLLEAKVADLDARKVVRDELWAQAQEEHDKASYIIQKGKEIIAAAMSKQSFLQKNVHMNFAQLSDHFATHAQKYVFKQKSWNSIFKLLSQILAKAPVQADQSLVQKVIAICDDLLNKIAESREIERRSYQHWVDEYNRTRDEVNVKLNEIKADIANLDQEIAALNKRINAATEERKEQTERVVQKTNQYQEYLKYCDDENANYAKRRENRDNDRQVVSDAIGVFQKNLRLFRKYVADRMKNVKKAK
jgi:flagellar motility protein MotE (MotC chaperone)